VRSAMRVAGFEARRQRPSMRAATKVRRATVMVVMVVVMGAVTVVLAMEAAPTVVPTGVLSLGVADERRGRIGIVGRVRRVGVVVDDGRRLRFGGACALRGEARRGGWDLG
jgi:hypothetical protein